MMVEITNSLDTSTQASLSWSIPKELGEYIATAYSSIRLRFAITVGHSNLDKALRLMQMSRDFISNPRMQLQLAKCQQTTPRRQGCLEDLEFPIFCRLLTLALQDHRFSTAYEYSVFTR
ncbi:hypothetical protein Tco_1065073 [Tanacetum coccineum]